MFWNVKVKKVRSCSIVMGGKTEVLGSGDGCSGSRRGTVKAGVSGFAFGRFLHL